MPKRIVLVDTPRGELEPVGRSFADVSGPRCQLRTVRSAGELLATLRDAEPPDLVLIDQALGDGELDGMALLAKVRQADGHVPIVLLAERGDVSTARSAIEAGATDYLVRAAQLDERVRTQLGKIRRIIALIDQNRALDEENRRLRQARGATPLVGDSPQIAAVRAQIERIANIPRPVLIRGERGTGKELVARAIHDASNATGAFVVVNCAAFADSLLDAELFGHEKGAYTGADQRAPGQFEIASDGTLFLDEIGHMTLAFQQKILRVVEYGRFLRVGGRAEVAVRTRIVAATNADLEKMMSEGAFLEDLYDRLAFEVITVPPLRERASDIETLAEHFLAEFIREVPAFRGKRLSEPALELLRHYDFPGNVRELKNIIERAVCRDAGSEIGPDDLGLVPHGPRGADAGTFKHHIEELERKLVREALEQADHNQAEAARLLGLAYHQLRYYKKKYEL